MSENYYRRTPDMITGETAGKVKFRIMMLVLFSTITVAIAFGASFYFGLISGGSAIAQQFPELGAIAQKMTKILMMNTVGFVAIIIGSFYLLGKIVTKRMFNAIGIITGNMQATADSGKISLVKNIDPGPFESLDSSYRAFVNRLIETENDEISKLQQIVDETSDADHNTSQQDMIRELIRKKKTKTGIILPGASTETGDSRGDNNPVFMQPV